MIDGADYFAPLMRGLQDAPAERAIELLTRAAEEHSSDARPLLLLAAELMHIGKADAAEAAYTLALQRDPRFAIARFQLGLLQFIGGRPAVASITWAALDALDSNDPLRLFKQGLECLARDDLAQAQSLLKRGIDANTTNAPLNRDMENILKQLALRTAGKTNTDADTAATATEDEHILLSAYRRSH
jgi:tetratricopeptide (TPR) repeat protein